MSGSDRLLLPVAETLASAGWCVLPGFWDDALIAALRDEAVAAFAAGDMQPAQVGRGTGRVLNPEIRSDHIRWLNGETAAQREYLARMDVSAQLLNRELFMGLQDYEAHYACYPPGAAYQRHRDSFQGSNPRRVSTVTYLNADWPADAGGELYLYEDEKLIAQVTPQAGTLVCFLSERFPHEVTASRGERFSIAGWFRVRSLEG